MVTGKSKQTKPLPRTRDRAAAEERLREAGLELFSQLGVDGATTKLISQKAGVNESLIIRYFGSKEGLLIAILRGFIEEQNSKELSYPAQNSLQQELLHYMRAELEEMISKKDFIRVMTSKASVDQKFARTLSENHAVMIDPRLVERFKSFQKRKLVRSDQNPEQLAHIVGLQLFSAIFVCYTLLEMPRSYIDGLVETFARSFGEGLN